MGLLEELAVRCEAATEPDRDLETEIAVAVHGGEIVWKQANYTMEMYPARKYASADHVGGFGNAPVAACTSSLDAAMSLVPPNHGISMGDYGFAADGRHHAELRPGGYQSGGQDTFDSKGIAATLPLAICAAALRARHALALSKGDAS